MMKLTQCTKTFGDCTAGYRVELDHVYTLREFRAEVETRGDWGMLEVTSQYGISRTDYQSTMYERGYIPDNILDMNIISVSAHGGWSLMDFKVTVA